MPITCGPRGKGGRAAAVTIAQLDQRLMVSVDLQHAALHLMAPLRLFTQIEVEGRLENVTLQLQPYDQDS